MWVYVLVAGLLLIAIAVQVLYAWKYSSQMTTSAKIVMGVNIALLVALLIGVFVMAYMRLGG